MKPFLSGCLLGVCITVGVFYLRGPVSQRFLAHRTASREAAAVVVPLRPGEPSIGSATAAVTMIEYSDFQCPYCAMFRARTFPQLKAKYIDTGKMRFIARHFPLPGHQHAMLAAQAAACAGEQGSYWRLSDVMFSRANCIECQGVLELSKSIPLDRGRFEKCVSSNRLQPQIDQDVASARQLNFEGTPSFVIGRATAKGVEGVAISGALPIEKFEARIERVMTARE